MSPITERQKFILDKMVQEYIRQAVPVSSQVLERKYDIGLKPASIRLELHRLTDLGYLLQPHISAGRVPTDRGYRFFVDELFEQKRFTFSEEKISEKLSLLEKEVPDVFRFLSELTKLLADCSSNLAFTFIAEEMIFFKEGWLRVLREPEFQNLNCAREFMRTFQELEQSIEEFFQGKEELKIKVLIGKESKISCAKDFSVILSPAKFPKKRKGALAVLGPKRMHYSRNIGLINSLVKFLEKC